MFSYFIMSKPRKGSPDFCQRGLDIGCGYCKNSKMRNLCYRKCYATNKEKFKKMDCEMLGKGIQLIKWKDNSGWFSKYS